jgi:TonB family protein
MRLPPMCVGVKPQYAIVVVLFLLLVTSLRAQQDTKPETGKLEGISGVRTAESKAILAGQLLHRVDPTYSKEARKRKLEGQVILRATIQQDGTVGNISVVSGEVMLAESAVDAVREWRFEPYTQDGMPIKVLQNLSFTFARDKKIAEFDPNLTAPIIPSEAAIIARTPQKSSTPETAFRVGGGVTAPKAIFAPDPAYDKEARKAKYQGTCLLSMIVGADGVPRDIKVVRALGKGLDEKAVETVGKWKFEPATKDGKPVAVVINVEINFRLY